MPNLVTRRVALVGDDGRFDDAMAPQVVLDAVEQVEAIRSEMLAKSANLADVPDPTAARSHLGAAPATHTHQIDQVTGLPAALAAKADLVGGVIPTSQIPREALGDAEVVADEAEMLALTPEQVQPGDIAIRLDGGGSWILKSADPSVLASWVRLNSTTDVVTSVQGQQGDVVLSATDVGAATPDYVDAQIEQVEITAEGFAQQAAGSAVAAGQSATTAATERQGAQTARGGAETARSGAEAALAAVPAAVTDQVTSQVVPQVVAATTAKNDAVTAKNAAELARSQTEQIYVLLGNVSGTKTMTLADANMPTAWDATLTGNTDFILPSLGNRVLTCSIYLVAGVAGVTYRVLAGKVSYSQVLVHSGALNGVDLVHLLHYGPRGWIVLSGAAALGVPAGWVS